MLSLEEVKKLANLARLEFSDEDLGKFQTQLSDILEYVAQLQEVITDDVEPTYQVTGLENITRPDKIEKWTKREELLQSSNLSQRDGMIEVPSVFE